MVNKSHDQDHKQQLIEPINKSLSHRPSMSHTVVLGDMSLQYYEHGHCSLFWVDPTYTNLLL